MNPFLIDIETQSAVDISNVLNYVSHPSTRIMCAVGKTLDSEPIVWIPANVQTPKELDKYKSVDCPFPTNIPWVAHNAFGFDSLVWRRATTARFQPYEWLDTIPMCRAVGLPGSLDKSSKSLGFAGKLDNSIIIKSMCMAKYRADRTYEYPVGTRAIWDKLIEYNIQDVLLLESVWKCVEPHFHDWEFMRVHQLINERGVYYDKKFAFLIDSLWNHVQHNAYDKVAELTDGKLKDRDLNSHVKVKSWLSAKGMSLTTLNKQYYLEEMAEYTEEDHPDLPLVLEVLKERQNAIRGSKGKVTRLLEVALHTPDDRLRHAKVMNGARTGRSSSRGVQIDNLAKALDKKELKRILSLYEERGTLTTEDLGVSPGDRLTELMRPTFCAPPGKVLNIGDYSQIEARCLAWLADEPGMLAAFADSTRDIYCEMASRLFGRTITKADDRERQLGKIVVLGCGYGMGSRKFEIFCRLAKPKINLVELGLNAESVIKTYRESAPSVVRLWKEFTLACESTVDTGIRILQSKVEFSMDKKNLHILLPSGRALIYRNARIEMRVPGYCLTLGLPPFKKPTVVYDNPYGYASILHGGILTENIDQAISNDILRDALIRAEQPTKYREKFNVVMHVHDSIISEDDNERVDELTELMHTIPSWAIGFPLRAEVHCSKRNL